MDTQNNNVKIGYGRVSTSGQNLESQLVDLKAYGCLPENIFTDKKTGDNIDRNGLTTALLCIRKGESFVISRLDRLGRSLEDILKIKRDLEKKGCHLVILNMNIDTSTTVGRLLFGIVGLMGEFEQQLRRERQSDGIAVAKAKGIYEGRTSICNESIYKIKELHKTGLSIRKIAREVNLSPTTVMKYKI